MTLQQLRYLLALDDHRHFGRAARSCFVAQPTLTTQIKKLEDYLGVQLINRRLTPVAPTVVGTKVIAQARIILDEIEGLKSLLHEETTSLNGTYSLGVIPTLAPHLLPLFVQSFAEAFPQVKLLIREMQSERIMDELKRKKLDLGLLVTPLEDKQLREIPLFYEPFLVYGAPGESILEQEPLLPRHIRRQDLLILEKGHCFRSQVLNLCGSPRDKEQESSRPYTFQAGSIETLKNMVRHNKGYTIIPEMSVVPRLDEPYVRRFADPQPAREVSLVVSRSFAREKLIGELRREIQRVVPESFRKSGRYVSVAWR